MSWFKGGLNLAVLRRKVWYVRVCVKRHAAREILGGVRAQEMDFFLRRGLALQLPLNCKKDYYTPLALPGVQ